MHITISVATSIDGYLDDNSPKRLLLSNEEDFKQVDILRSQNDGILIGANTLRKDDPSLTIKDGNLQQKREKKGQSKHPIKVSISNTLDLNPDYRFFGLEDTKKIIFTKKNSPEEKKKQLGSVCNIIEIDTKYKIEPSDIIEQLEKYNIENLLVEGGGNICNQFLSANLVNKIRIAIAPIYLGDTGGTKFINSQKILDNFKLKKVEQIENMAILHYEI